MAPHVLGINLSNDVNFMREKSSLQAGTGARIIPPPSGLALVGMLGKSKK